MPKAKKMNSGRWRVRVYTGTTADGKKKYKSITASSKKEAEHLATTFMLKQRQTGNEMTIHDAVERYIETRSAVLSPTTIQGYDKILRVNLDPIKNYRICDLTDNNIQAFINSLAKEKSAKTVSNIYGLLSAAIKQQDASRILSIRLPRRVKRLVDDLPQSAAVVDAVKGSSIELPVLLSMWLCLRLSEVRGITKSSVHNGILFIDKVKVVVGGKDVVKVLAKTNSSRRTIKLPPLLLDMIERHPTEEIVTISARALYFRFVKLMREHGYDNVRFHDLRHIAASDMNRLGIPDKVAAERGGWATTYTMRAVYQHAFSADREMADDLINEYYTNLFRGESHSQITEYDSKDDTHF